MRLKRRFAIASAMLAVCFVATSSTSMGEELSDRYGRTILSEEDLAGYWRMENDLTDKKANATGIPNEGLARFVDGPGGGKALSLGNGQFVTVEKTPHLDMPETTVELFFKLLAKPTSNGCLIAKRSAQETRFSVHVSQDLTQVLIWNGRTVFQTDVPLEPLRVGPWYHLAVSSTESSLAVYLNGVPCARIANDGFNLSAMDLPLRIGAATPDGFEQCVCAVDEVAVYSRVLSEEEIKGHVDAIGWAERSKELRAAMDELNRQKRARQEARRGNQMDVLARRMNDPRLVAQGRTRVYSDDDLTAISLPLGGIGAGSIQIDGTAERAIWQIFNNYEGVFVPHSFFAIRARMKDGQPVLRALQTRAVGPFEAMDSLRFRGEYPFGWYDFEDAALPVVVSMETFSPLIPLRARDSAIPCAIFNLMVKNTSDKHVEVSLLATQQNAVGFTGDGTIEGRRFKGYGGNSNRILKEEGATILHMTAKRKFTTRGDGDMALAVFEDRATGTASWDSLDSLWSDVSEHSVLSGESAGPSPAGQTLDGALAVPVTLEPGKSREVAFVLSWYFPNVRHGQREWGGTGNMYANWWDNALSVTHEIRARFDELSQLTRLYHDTLYAANLPHWLIDRISSQVAVLRSKTCFWTRDGFFGAWEGCCPQSGCCHGNCAHVWHYAQAHARLFPSIARRMREQALHYQQPDGGIPFRLPRSNQACDGQCGEVLEAYREHLVSADGTWLHERWPRIKKAIEHVITRWDTDEDGVLGGVQHNTLDCELGGSSSWLGTLYLAALRASEKMAESEGDGAAAQRYRRICESGGTKQNETLWNGEYYFQLPAPKPQRDYNNGCHIDQVLGQWWAHQLDLGWLYPPDRVSSALRALLKHNFQDNFHGIPQKPRKFVHDNDAGMQMITWPEGDRPANHTLYADEVMTGFEYSAAAAMVQADMLKEGFMVVQAVADRYDGRLREGLTPSNTASWGYSGNPFGDDECGKFYARAMSVWSMLLASQGFIYDGPAGRIGFKPIWQPEDHATFFTAAEGWGLFTQSRTARVQTEQIEVKYGRLKVRELVFELPETAKPLKVNARVDSQQTPVSVALDAQELRLTPEKPIILEAGSVLTLIIEH